MGANYTENQPCGSPAARAQCTTGATIVFPCDTLRKARYVTLNIDPTRPEVTFALLQLAEVTVKEYIGGECGKVHAYLRHAYHYFDHFANLVVHYEILWIYCTSLEGF